MLFLFAIWAAASFLPNTVSSYKIDQSCVTKGVALDVKRAMESAFQMTGSAIRHLNQNPYDQDTADLIRRLFLAKDGQDVNDRSKMSKVLSIFENINRYYRAESTAEVAYGDVTIYCDGSRFTDTGKRDKFLRKLYRDTTTNTIVLYKEQSCHDGLNDIATLAVTSNPQEKIERWNEVKGELEIEWWDAPTQIQVCPWMIDWIKNKEFKLGNDVARTNIGRTVVKIAEKNRVLRQVDALSLLDKVLLHEMTHGRDAFTDRRIDMEPSRIEGVDDVQIPWWAFLPFTPKLSQAAYGWKAARRPAQTGDDVVGELNWKARAPDHNADSLALFGSAASLLDHEWPRRVLDDGSLYPIGV